MKPAAAFINQYDSFAVAAHFNPDGDAIGATLGLVHVLRDLGKTAHAYNQDLLPKVLEFLPGGQDLIHDVNELPEIDAVIVLDCGDKQRTGKAFEQFIGEHPTLNIDHHQTNSGFADVDWIEERKSSTGEMIVELARELGATISPQAAICLYTAIITDTGNFKFANTSADTLRAAADMVAAGARPELAATNYYHMKPAAYLTLLREFLGGLDFNQRQTRADATLTLAQYQNTGATPETSDGFINLLMDVETVKVAIFFREVGPDVWKMSMRSKDQVDVAAIAARHGGGGHKNAAGCKLDGTLEQVKAIIREQVESII